MIKQEFKAESKRLLDLMINSIYTHKEIFLREIISNASDAIDKLYYNCLNDENINMSREDFKIQIKIDKQNKTITVSDNGIGMSKEELENNLGTIAKSGSFQFKNDLNNDSDNKEISEIDIIGQFGVGFYSAFMVAEEITVISKQFGSDTSYQWYSTGADGYTIEESDKDSHGTDIIMKIKEDTEEEKYTRFLEENTISSLIKKYSDYIHYPITMDQEKQKPKEGGEENETESYIENVTLNSMVPLWQRNKSEITEEDYNNFYKEKFNDYENPLKYTHIDAEGVFSYKAILFIPSRASYDYYTKEYKKGLQLYSSGVLIMDKCEDLIPEHFRFVRGIVDSPDLSLNISREMLQHNHQLKKIANNIEKKIKAELKKLLQNERETYEKFYKHFGAQLKYSIANEYGMNKDILQDLLLFNTSFDQKLCTLSEYVSRMKDEQKYIYFATAETVQKASMLPQTERIKEKGYEILYFDQEVDEFVAQILNSYEGKEFRSINSDDLGIETEEEKKEIEKQSEDNKDLIEFIKSSLENKVDEVKISQKLKNHPACISAVGPISFEMEKYMNNMQTEAPMKAQRALEINPSHELFEKLKNLYSTDENKAKNIINILYYQSLLLADLPITDLQDYSNLVYDLI